MRFLLLLLIICSGALRAEVEIIPLRHRTVDQVIPVLRPLVEPGGDGMPAFISTGQSQPQPTRNVTRAPDGALIVTDSVSYRDVSTGFEVVPRVSGERVFLDINPRRETPGPGGTLNVQRMSTSASARLGEWFEIGGLAISSNTQSSGILSSSNAQRQENRRVWVKVEEQK